MAKADQSLLRLSSLKDTGQQAETVNRGQDDPELSQLLDRSKMDKRPVWNHLPEESDDWSVFDHQLTSFNFGQELTKSRMQHILFRNLVHSLTPFHYFILFSCYLANEQTNEQV